MVKTEASGLSLRAIRDYAERVGEHYGVYDDEGWANLDALVEELGGVVEIHTGPESLIVAEEGDFTIYVPETTSTRRDRFTVAHELGHYFLHYLYAERKGAHIFGRGLTNRAETEANTFASSLLMPKAAFKAAHARFDGDTRSLASLFEVSPRAAEVRCDILGLAW